MASVFDTDEVNTSRRIEFDMAKVLYIIIMVCTHSFEEFHYVSDLDTHPLYIGSSFH